LSSDSAHEVEVCILVEKSEADGIRDAPVSVGLANVDVRIALLAPDLEAASAAGEHDLVRNAGTVTMFVAQKNAPLFVRRCRVGFAVKLSNRHSLFRSGRLGFLNPLLPSIEF
jgi:hypothetical protein